MDGDAEHEEEAMTRDQIETLAMSTGIGLLMFLALAAVVRWLRFVIVGSLPVLAIVLVAAVPVLARRRSG